MKISESIIQAKFDMLANAVQYDGNSTNYRLTKHNDRWMLCVQQQGENYPSNIMPITPGETDGLMSDSEVLLVLIAMCESRRHTRFDRIINASAHSAA